MLGALAWIAALALAACGDDPGTDAGAGADAGVGADAGADMDAAAATDAGADAGAETDAEIAADAGPLDAGPYCLDGVGLARPVPVCSTAEPCTELLASYALLDPPVDRIETASDRPVCGTTSVGIGRGQPMFDDGAPSTWTDPDGVDRFWCEHRPAGTSSTSPRPVVIWVPPSGSTADGLYDTTSLRSKAPTYDLSGDPTRPGFILVSIQPRNLRWPTADPQQGTKSDSFFRDLGAPSTNPDIALLDHVVDALVSEGVADPARIFVSGWSNGARMSGLYGIARHGTPTPGGNQIAAVANYSGGDPFAPPTFADEACRGVPYPTSTVPFLLVSRTCDEIACNAAADDMAVPGNVVEPWVTALRDQIGADVTWVRIDDDGVERAACAIAGLCGPTRALLNHVRWPDGVGDRSGNDLEPRMLDFLRDHPLP